MSTAITKTIPENNEQHSKKNLIEFMKPETQK